MPVGDWRSVHNHYNAFAVESFMDEVAAATGGDPLALRRALLGAPRRAIAGVLALAAQSERLGDAYRPRGMPAASPLDAGFGSYVAQIAEVSVAAKAGSSCIGWSVPWTAVWW